MDEIAKNGYNLNISRYVIRSQAGREIDLAATHAQPLRIDEDIRIAKDKAKTGLTSATMSSRETGLGERCRGLNGGAVRCERPPRSPSNTFVYGTPMAHQPGKTAKGRPIPASLIVANKWC